MVEIKQGLTKGLEKLEFLTDKTARMVFELRSEEQEITELRNEVRLLRNKRNDLKNMNSTLEEKLSSLEKDNVKMDVKVEGLLEAISVLSPE